MGIPEVRYADDDAYARRLRELLERAVADRVDSTYAVGVHLSGGLDCSGVAVLAQRRLRERGQTVTGFSWSPPPGGAEDADDERRLVALIAESEAIAVHHSTVSARASLAAHLRHPVFHSGAQNVREVSVRTTAAGLAIRTLLSGWGGDELISFNGRGRFADLLRRGRVRHMWRELSLRGQIHGGVVWKEAVARGIFPLLPAALLRRVYPAAVLDLWVSGPLPDLPLTTAFGVQLQRAQSLPRLPGRERAGVRQTQLDLLAREHITARVEGWAAAGGQAGLVYVYPLLDRRVVEFALGLPPQMFFQHGWKRDLYRYAMDGILPHAVRWNKSKREPALLRKWERVQEEESRLFVAVVEQILRARPTTQLLDLQRMHELVAAPATGTMDSVRTVMAGMTIEMLVNQEFEELVAAQLAMTPLPSGG